MLKDSISAQSHPQAAERVWLFGVANTAAMLKIQMAASPFRSSQLTSRLRTTAGCAGSWVVGSVFMLGCFRAVPQLCVIQPEHALRESCHGQLAVCLVH